jgi:hypothetical protein
MRTWRRRSEDVRRPRDPTVVAMGPWEIDGEPGRTVREQRTAVVKTASIREEGGAEWRPACSGGRTAGPLHAVL